jgi:predicted amidohydrolase
LASLPYRIRAEEREAAGPYPDEVKVAAVQITGYDKHFVRKPGFDPSDSIVRYVDRAGKDGARLVVFPEYHLGHFSIPCPMIDKIAEAARRNEIYVIVGGWEVFDDQSFSNTALIFDRRGEIVGKYNKTHAAVDSFEGEPAFSKPPSGHDRQWFIENDPEWIMKRGDDLPVFDLDFAKIGILTCYDGYFPETFRVLSLKGAEIVVWINGRHGQVQDFFVKTAMFRNTISMICTNQDYGTDTMIAEWPLAIKAHCPEAKEDYITATLNLKRLRLARKNSRDFQQRRPDLYGEIPKEHAVWKAYEGLEE